MVNGRSRLLTSLLAGALLLPVLAFAAERGKVVRVVDGERIVTDGPFAETKEQIGGVFMTSLPDLDEAIRIAALVPAAEYGSLEIRPIVER